MIVPTVVTVLIDGNPVLAATPAVLLGGTVSAPIDPYARLIATRIVIDSRLGSITFERGTAKVTINEPLVRDAEARIPLGVLARELGERVDYDAATHTLAIVRPALPLATMIPFAPWTPPPGPLATFTPEPSPLPQPTVSGIPVPRRTPIVVTNKDPHG